MSVEDLRKNYVRLDRRDVIRSRLSRSYGDWIYYRAGLTISGTLVQPRCCQNLSPPAHRVGRSRW